MRKTSENDSYASISNSNLRFDDFVTVALYADGNVKGR